MDPVLAARLTVALPTPGYPQGCLDDCGAKRHRSCRADRASPCPRWVVRVRRRVSQRNRGGRRDGCRKRRLLDSHGRLRACGGRQGRGRRRSGGRWAANGEFGQRFIGDHHRVTRGETRALIAAASASRDTEPSTVTVTVLVRCVSLDGYHSWTFLVVRHTSFSQAVQCMPTALRVRRRCRAATGDTGREAGCEAGRYHRADHGVHDADGSARRVRERFLASANEVTIPATRPTCSISSCSQAGQSMPSTSSRAAVWLSRDSRLCSYSAIRVPWTTSRPQRNRYVPARGREARPVPLPPRGRLDAQRVEHHPCQALMSL